jgi:hypothetical protein
LDFKIVVNSLNVVVFTAMEVVGDTTSICRLIVSGSQDGRTPSSSASCPLGYDSNYELNVTVAPACV